MFECQLHFDETLKRFLHPRLRKMDGIVRIRRTEADAPVKDLIESCGIPHPVVAGICKGEQWVSLDHIPDNEERLQVLGIWNEGVRSLGDRALQEFSLPEWRFVLDGHLGKLTRFLRLLGFDCSYDSAADDDALIETMLEGERILVTRDRRLLMRRVVRHAYHPLSDHPMTQLRELFKRFELAGSVKPFTRCLMCNGLLIRASKEEVMDQLEPLTKKYYHEFAKCADCRRVYWEGSHYEKLNQVIAFARESTARG